MIYIKPKIYKDIREWYYPEIPYEQMLRNFRMTENYLNRAEIGIPDAYPLDHISLFEYSGLFKKGEGHEQQKFQFWNREFNDQIVRAIYVATSYRKPKLILDVCAGDGMLASVLANRGFNVKASDDYTWPFKERYFDVERRDYKEAIKKYRPDFIIGSWMPLHTDWTPYFRRIKSVKSYMIIGEGDGGCCGGNWEQRKDWEARYHDLADPYSLCRTDVIWSFKEEKEGFELKHSGVFTLSRYEQ